MKDYAWLLAAWLCGLLPLAWLERACVWVERLPGLSFSPGFRAARRNYELLGIPGRRAGRLARRASGNLCRSVVEFFAWDRKPSLSVECRGMEHIRAVKRSGKGAIIITGHAGNWELGAAVLSSLGFDMAALAWKHPSRLVNQAFDDRRRKASVDVIALGEDAFRRSMRALRAGKCLGVLGDVDFTGHAQELPFGRGRMRFPTGPALLSMGSGAPLVPMFLVRLRPWRFRLHVFAPIHPPERTDPAALQTMIQAYADCLHILVKRHASQWLVFQEIMKNHD